jgi:hypothetical protein
MEETVDGAVYVVHSANDEGMRIETQQVRHRSLFGWHGDDAASEDGAVQRGKEEMVGHSRLEDVHG